MISSAPNMSKKRMKREICVFELQTGRQLAGNSDFPLCIQSRWCKHYDRDARVLGSPGSPG